MDFKNLFKENSVACKNEEISLKDFQNTLKSKIDLEDQQIITFLYQHYKNSNNLLDIKLMNSKITQIFG